MLRSLVLALTAAVLASPPACAGSPVIVDQVDPTGDVNVFDGGGSKPSPSQRRSIDLERFTVTRAEDGVRLAFRIARITGSRTFDQIVEVQLGKGASLLDLQANPQGRHATAYVENDTACLVNVSTSRRRGVVRVDLPTVCLPHGSGVLRVTTYTQKRNLSGPGYSEDTMRVKGSVSLR